MLRKGRKLCSANLPQPPRPRVCARWAFRPVSAGSKQSAGLPLVDLAGFDLPLASDLPTASRRRRSLTSFQTEIWRQSTASRLCFLRRLSSRSRSRDAVSRSATFEKVDETFHSRSFASCSLWLFSPRFGCYLTQVSVPLLMRSSPSYCPANAGSVLWHTWITPASWAKSSSSTSRAFSRSRAEVTSSSR